MNNNYYTRLFTLFCAAGLSLVFLGGCELRDKMKKKVQVVPIVAPGGVQARAILHPTKGSKVKGEVTFSKMPDGGVLVIANIDGLEPGIHGFHIHEHGDCSAPDASSAGGHFDPLKKRHGGPEEFERHTGDLGNVVADDEGHAYYQRVDLLLELNGPDSIIGRSVIIHAAADDFKTQPTGNSGGRVACGRIDAALPASEEK